MSSPEFLVVRLGAMGDVLHAMPAVAALRLALPNSRVRWVVDPRWLPLLAESTEARSQTEAMPLVDGYFLADTKAWTRKPFAGATVESVMDLRRELRAQRFDAVMDLQGSIRSAVISKFARAGRVVGSASPRELPAQWMYGERVVLQAQHVIEQAAEIASAVCGVKLQPAETLLPKDFAAERWCDEFVARECGGKEIAVVTASAGWGAKRWPAARYGEVAAGLAERGLAVLVNCGPGDEEIAREVVAASGDRARLLQATLPQLIAVLRRTRIFVGGDTGPLHLAAALRVPVVGLYGPTDPARNGPYGTRSVVLRHASSKRDHTRHAETEAGLRAIPAAAALDAAHGLLQQSKDVTTEEAEPSMTLLTKF